MKRPLRILMVEDSEDDAALVARELGRADYDLTLQRVETEPDLRAALHAGPWDAILSDYSMPGFDGLHALRIVRDVDNDVPFILVSGNVGEETAVAAMKAGANDYVMKNRLARLSPAVEREMRELQSRKEHALARTELSRRDELFRALVTHGFDLIFLVAANGCVRYAAPSTSTLLGREECDVVGQPLAEIVHHHDLDRYKGLLLHSANGNGLPGVPTEIRLLHRSGEWRTFEMQARDLSEDPVVGGLIVNARDVTERARQEREMVAVAAVTAALRTSTSHETTLPAIVDLPAELLNTDGALLAVLNASGSTLLIERALGCWSGLSGRSVPLFPLIDVSDPSVEDGDADDIDGHLRVLEMLSRGPNQTPLVTPLIAHEQFIGALWMARASPFDVSETRLVTAIADVAASWLHRVMLLKRTEQRLRRLSALRNVEEAITETLDLPTLLDRLLTQTTSELQVDAARVTLINSETGVLEYAAGRGFQDPNLAMTAIPGVSLLSSTDRGVRQWSAFDELVPEPMGALLTGERFVSAFSISLVAKGRLHGLLELFDRHPIDPDPEWNEFLETIAGQAAIALDHALLFRDTERSNDALIAAYDSTLVGWTRALELRDHETEGHTQRVADLTVQLARRMGYDGESMIQIRRGALLHDIGKMGLPDAVLLKPGPLTHEEWETVRMHPVFARDMLQPIEYLHTALDIPYCHHERWDGSGYPRGLAGEEIPAVARIFSVVDVWDALCTDRPYRKGWPVERVVEYIRSLSGSHFDPEVVTAFMQLLTDLGLA